MVVVVIRRVVNTLGTRAVLLCLAAAAATQLLLSTYTLINGGPIAAVVEGRYPGARGQRPVAGGQPAGACKSRPGDFMLRARAPCMHLSSTHLLCTRDS